MGYTLTIGETSGHFSGRQVTPASSEQAPIIPGDGANSQSNKRQPSYSDWADFCDATGLRPLFYLDLIARHPGIVSLTSRHQAAISEAKRRYQQAHPAAQARYSGVVEDAHLARLVWLEWWVSWALAHCRRPAIENR